MEDRTLNIFDYTSTYQDPIIEVMIRLPYKHIKTLISVNKEARKIALDYHFWKNKVLFDLEVFPINSYFVQAYENKAREILTVLVKEKIINFYTYETLSKLAAEADVETLIYILKQLDYQTLLSVKTPNVRNIIISDYAIIDFIVDKYTSLNREHKQNEVKLDELLRFFGTIAKINRQDIIYYFAEIESSLAFFLLENLPNENVNDFSADMLGVDSELDLFILKRYIDAGYEPILLYSALMSEETEWATEYRLYVLEHMKESELIYALVYALNDGYIYGIKEILLTQKLTFAQIYDTIIETLKPEIVEYIYDDDLSEIGTLLNQFTDLSDLHLLKQALEVNNIPLIKEIVEYVITEDEDLLQSITDLDIF
jgi:hypothetical protein